ncbi:MAG: hypothetical protein M1825_004065 [Sarcosagium campestre]|nr:MAG: hypothetical protein M1825_004065 [Sarcosagium campestre]
MIFSFDATDEHFSSSTYTCAADRGIASPKPSSILEFAPSARVEELRTGQSLGASRKQHSPSIALSEVAKSDVSSGVLNLGFSRDDSLLQQDDVPCDANADATARHVSNSPHAKENIRHAGKDEAMNIGSVNGDTHAEHSQARISPFLPNVSAPGKASAKRKKKKRKGMKPAAPALVTVRGFTPVASGDEDSDFSTTSNSSRLPFRPIDGSSGPGSPLMRPSSACSQGGISAMKLKLDTLNLESSGPERIAQMTRSRSQLGSYVPSPSNGTTSEVASDDDTITMGTYEVPLQDDFVSADLEKKPIVAAIEGGLVADTASRKMTAVDFEPLRCLGKGTYGTVLLVKQRSTGRLFAQKQLRKASLVIHKKLVEQTKTERSILESVNRHPFVVKLFYAFQDHEKLYLILEYAQGGELFTHLAAERMFTEEVASFYMAEMILALDHLHRNIGVVYRDLKPENCLLDSEGHLLLTDFGLSKVAVGDDDHCRSILGTIEYMAPEVILGKKYGFAVDWWSLGALGFDLLTGSPPFQANNHAKMLDKITHQKLTLPYFLGPDAKDLLTRLLRKEPAKRLGSCMPRDLDTLRKHRFFRKIDWAALERRALTPPILPLITDPELAENFAGEFTDLALSPVLGTAFPAQTPIFSPSNPDGNPFGGFSFVASSSLLDWGEPGF